MARGGLFAESIRVGGEIEGIPLALRRIKRGEPSNVAPGQPSIWTLLEFDLADSDAPALANALSGVLSESYWYVDFQTEDENFVVFSGRIFRYARGDAGARAEVEAYARDLGLPASQLDWPE